MGGRTDHTLLLQRNTSYGHLEGEGKYQLRLVVSGETSTLLQLHTHTRAHNTPPPGDKLTHLEQVIFVPDAFTRRFQYMRAFNNIMSQSTVVGMILYAIGAAVATVAMLRRKTLRVRPAAMAALVLATMGTAARVNGWSEQWMYYDTASSATVFFYQHMVIATAQAFVLSVVGYTLAFAVAEGMTRWAFPNQVQLWSVWMPKVAASAPVLHGTAMAYAAAAAMVAWVVAFYGVMCDTMGWWVPASQLVDPNVLATPVPAISSIALATQAGTVEECMFRAVPLAGALLLHRRFGGRRWLWLGAGMVLQVVVFSAAHCNYPGQPSYARLVELTVPSTVFGLLYLRFGLVVPVVMHVVYDIVWMALALFIGTGSSVAAIANQAIVIAAALLPLVVAVVAVLRHGLLPVPPRKVGGQPVVCAACR